MVFIKTGLPTKDGINKDRVTYKAKDGTTKTGLPTKDGICNDRVTHKGWD